MKRKYIIGSAKFSRRITNLFAIEYFNSLHWMPRCNRWYTGEQYAHNTDAPPSVARNGEISWNTRGEVCLIESDGTIATPETA